MKLLLLLIALATVATACTSAEPTPEPTPRLDRRDVLFQGGGRAVQYAGINQPFLQVECTYQNIGRDRVVTVEARFTSDRIENETKSLTKLMARGQDETFEFAFDLGVGPVVDDSYDVGCLPTDQREVPN